MEEKLGINERFIPWKLLFIIISFFLIFISIHLILSSVYLAGDDFIDYCSATLVFNNSENPYDNQLVTLNKAEFGSNKLGSFSYPPITLNLFSILCNYFIVDMFRFYYILFVLIFLFTVYIAFKIENNGHNHVFLFTLLLTGFFATFWNFRTGNISIVYPLFMASIYYFLERRRYDISSLLTALMSIFTIFPILFSFLFLSIPKPMFDRIKIVLLAVGAIVVYLVTSYIFYPRLFINYVEKISGPTSQIYEVGSISTPTSYYFFRDIVVFFNLHTVFFWLFILVYLVGILFISYGYWKKNKNYFLNLFSFGILMFILLLPRLKFNYFSFILLPIFFLFKDFTYSIKTICLIIISCIPLGAIILYPTVNSNDILYLILSYATFFSTIGIFLLIAVISRTAPNTEN